MDKRTEEKLDKMLYALITDFRKVGKKHHVKVKRVIEKEVIRIFNKYRRFDYIKEIYNSQRSLYYVPNKLTIDPIILENIEEDIQDLATSVYGFELKNFPALLFEYDGKTFTWID